VPVGVRHRTGPIPPAAMVVVDVVGGNGPAARRSDDVQATAAVAALTRLLPAVTAPATRATAALIEPAATVAVRYAPYSKV
jgi:hypothetical protein